MSGAIRYPQGRALAGRPQSGTWVGAGDSWRLIPVQAEPAPSAAEYGLLDPTLAQEPDRPREGLLGQPSLQQSGSVASDLLVPPVKPWAPAGRDSTPDSYKLLPGAMRDQPLKMPPFIRKPYDEDWYPFDHAARRSGMPTEAEIGAARTIFGLEGGMQLDESGKDTDAGVSVAGITGLFLKDVERIRERLNRTEPVLPLDPKQLTLDDVARAYDLYFDWSLKDVGEGSALARINESKMAGQTADVLFHYQKPGGRMLQNGINTVVGSMTEAEQRRLGVTPVEVDGLVGPQTFSFLNRLIDAGYGHSLRNAVADAQLDQLREFWEKDPGGKASGVPFESRAGGMIDRVDNFR